MTRSATRNPGTLPLRVAGGFRSTWRRSARGTRYRIVSRWRVRGSARDVASVFADAESWARWWPAAFLDVRRRPGVEPETVRVHSKGWLPYTLLLEARTVESRFPDGCTFQVRGDFQGRCVCDLRQEGDEVVIRFDWSIRVRKPLLRWLSPVAKPVLVANHKWVMRQGYRSLEVELERLRDAARGEPGRARPPRPTFPYRSRSLPARLWRAVAETLLARAERRLRDAPW